MCTARKPINDKIWALTRLKAVASENFNLAKMLISQFDGVEKHCGKKRKCWLPPFSPLPIMFSKDLFLGIVKSRNCVIKSSSSNYDQ